MPKRNLKIGIKWISLLIISAILIVALVVYLISVNQSGKPPVVTSEEEATKVEQDLGGSISDIKDDLEQIKKSLGR